MALAKANAYRQSLRKGVCKCVSGNEAVGWRGGVKVHHWYQRRRQQILPHSFASVVDTGGKFAVGVNDTSESAPWAWGKLIHEKKDVENLVTLSL